MKERVIQIEPNGVMFTALTDKGRIFKYHPWEGYRDITPRLARGKARKNIYDPKNPK